MVRCDGVLIFLSCGVVTPIDGQDGMDGATCARRLDWMSAIYVSGLTAWTYERRKQHCVIKSLPRAAQVGCEAVTYPTHREQV